VTSLGHGLTGDIHSTGRRDQAKHARLERINFAAKSLLMDRTFEEITTKEVADLAGVGEATLFRYIGSKHRLLAMVYADALDAVLNGTEELDARAAIKDGSRRSDPRWYKERIYNAYRARCDFYLQNPHNAALYLRQGFDVQNEFSPRHLAQGDRTIRLVGTIMADGQRAGALRDDCEVDLVAQNLHGTFIHEMDRTPVRGYEPLTIWERLEPRLSVQLTPLFVCSTGHI